MTTTTTATQTEPTESQYAAIHALQKAGFAVIVWSPEELRGVDPEDVEERSIELGSEVIDFMTDEEDEEDEEKTE